MKPIADMLGRALKQTGSPLALRAVWLRAVGEIIARHSRPLRWEGSTLVIRADDAAWRAAIEQALPSVTERLAEAFGARVTVVVVVES